MIGAEHYGCNRRICKLGTEMTERLYTRLYWSSQQQGRAINGTGALGAEFEVQWELD